MGDYSTYGYTIVRDAIPHRLIDQLLDDVLSLINRHAAQTEESLNFEDAHSPDLVAFFNEHPEIESRVYDEVKEPPWLRDFCLDPGIGDPIRSLLGEAPSLLSKIVFRIDMPRWVHELALWHQDYRYVRGNTRIVTAWIPMQDTTFEQGPISVMPGSHQLGALEHDIQIGKRHVPSGIFDREIRMVEMRKGDLLLFDALLLHSSNLNLSDRIRYSIQARYTPAGMETDPGMGEPIPLSASRA